MQYTPKLIPVTFKKRYKRFLADVVTEAGQLITVHCPNTGAMTGCQTPDTKAYLFDSQNDKRKYRYTLEFTSTPEGDLICVNTHRANQLVHDAVNQGLIAELSGYSHVQTEVKYGQENSRIDLLLSKENETCYVEVKSVTLLHGEQGCFPDAKSERAKKHVRELMHIKAAGHRAVLLFLVQHQGINQVTPAWHIDAEYGELLMTAQASGVEILAYKTHITGHTHSVAAKVPFELHAPNTRPVSQK